MYDGWFCLGGTEIINNTRVMDYARTASCPVWWFIGDRCAGINDRTDETPYLFTQIENAPWYDQDVSILSSQFLGVYCLSQQGIDNETIEANVTERVVGGGVIGRQRDGSKSVRFRVVLTATTSQGLEYGRAWLANVLRENLCGVHQGSSCGTSSLTFMTMCPPPFDPNGGASKGMYWSEMDRETRLLHGVKCTGGLIKEQEFNRNGAFGGVYEFTLTAEEPRMLGVPYFLAPSNQGDLIIQDAPFNLMNQPSAELSASTVVTARNYSTNPSLETNATGWSAGSDGVNITLAMIASARVTGELAAVGTASFRVVFTASGAGTNGWFSAQQTVTLGGGAGARYSFNIWSAEVIMASTPTQGDLEVQAIWQDAGSVTLRTDLLGTIDVDGGYVSVKSVAPPVGATKVIVRARAHLTAWSAGAIVRLYTDALAVTVP